MDSPARSRRLDRVVGVVVAIALLALLARFVWLGRRMAHQDEARVAYWSLRYMESGVWSYRPIVHGPFMFHANRIIFGVLGPSDFAMRVAPALIGGLLPLSALLFRGRLRDSETVALAAFLAANPVLLYYSRFMRSDVLLGAFVLVALGCFVRAYDRRSLASFYAGVVSLAVSLTTKENALIYLLCWGGALVLLFDHRLFLARVRGSRPGAVAAAFARQYLPVDLSRVGQRATPEDDRGGVDLSGTVAAVRDAVSDNRRAIGHATLSVVVFFGVVVLFYAPRNGGYPGYGGVPDVGLWSSLGTLATGDPGPFAAVVEESLVGSWRRFVGQWATSHGNAYLPMFEDFTRTMRAGAGVLTGFAVLGFLADRYSPEGPRDVVAMAGYWGFVSILGYPVVTDIAAPWATVHAIVPLAIPAAVGLGIVLRWSHEALADGDRVGFALAAIIVLAAAAPVAAGAYQTSYTDPVSQDNDLVQYAQSSTDMKATLAVVRDIAAENDGVDVTYYGSEFASPNESVNQQAPAAPGGWFGRLPMAWYFEVYEYELEATPGPGGAFTVSSTTNRYHFREHKPPVIIATGEDATNIKPLLSDYTVVEHQRYNYASRVEFLFNEETLGDRDPDPNSDD